MLSHIRVTVCADTSKLSRYSAALLELQEAKLPDAEMFCINTENPPDHSDILGIHMKKCLGKPG